MTAARLSNDAFLVLVDAAAAAAVVRRSHWIGTFNLVERYRLPHALRACTFALSAAL